MKRKLLQSNLIIFSVMLFCMTCFNTFGQQVKKISVQGFLKDGTGKAVTDGNQEITFKLYSTETGGTAAWTGTQTVKVTGGVYSAYLGTATNPIDGLNWGTSTYFVGVTVGIDELTPRTELTFAPYSLGSPFAEKANFVVCSGAVGDVKYSVLNPQQFATVNGSCWVPMDGRTLAANDKLKLVTGANAVPNAGGLFLRGQESQDGSTDNDPERSPGSAIAQIQQDDYKSHLHSYSNTVSINGTTASGGDYFMVFANQKFIPNGDASSAYALTPYATLGEIHTKTVPSHSHAFSASGTASGSSNNSGGNETRPKNLNLWTYIRIN